MSFAVEVIADRSGKWSGNGLRFATEAEAKDYALDLADRWHLVTETRVVPSEEPPNRVAVVVTTEVPKRKIGRWD